MNAFDQSVVTFVNSFAQRSTTFDRLVVFHTHQPLLQGTFAMTVYWWGWFRRGKHDERNEHSQLLATLAGAFIAFLLGREDYRHRLRMNRRHNRVRRGG